MTMKLRESFTKLQAKRAFCGETTLIKLHDDGVFEAMCAFNDVYDGPGSDEAAMRAAITAYLQARPDGKSFKFPIAAALDYEWEGNTDVFWDLQQTVFRDDEPVYHEDGEEWLESQIVLRDDEPAPATRHHPPDEPWELERR